MFNLECEVCGNDRVVFDSFLTLSVHKPHLEMSLLHMDEIIKDVICKFSAYKCDKCNAVFYWTYKDVEKKARRALTKQLVYSFIANGTKSPVMMKPSEKVLIYCGKCPGFDGNGACPVIIHDDCKVKRLPVCDQIL
jgi:hypothetical protein